MTSVPPCYAHLSLFIQVAVAHMADPGGSFSPSMHAYQREKMKEEKRRQLAARRERLQQLLLEEQDLLARELEELRLSMNLREKRIREQHRTLKSAREEQRKLVRSHALGSIPAVRAVHAVTPGRSARTRRP